MAEPSDEMVNVMLTQIKGKQYNRIIAIGGGTVIDIAKLFVFGSEHSCEEIFAKSKTLPRKSKLLLLPTTCGTGSEVTNISIVNFIQKDTKIGLAEPALYADEAILIPELLATMPYQVFTHASIDALIHAMESYVSPKTNVFTRALGRSAIEQILAGYQKLETVLTGALGVDVSAAWSSLFTLLGKVEDLQPLHTLGIEESQCEKIVRRS